MNSKPYPLGCGEDDVGKLRRRGRFCEDNTAMEIAGIIFGNTKCTSNDISRVLRTCRVAAVVTVVKEFALWFKARYTF